MNPAKGDPQSFSGKTGAEGDIRSELCAYAARLKQRGLTSATGGNLSYRSGADMWISPTGCALDELQEDDWVRVHLESGEAYPHRYRPSSEVVLHREIYAVRPDISAVYHTHPPHVIALSLLGIELKPIGSEAPITLGNSIPLVPYEIPTSPRLAQAVVPSAREHNVLVLENHGLVTLGRSNREAYLRAELAEEIAHIMAIAYSLGKGEPRWPTGQQIAAYRDWHFNRKLPPADQ